MFSKPAVVRAGTLLKVLGVGFGLAVTVGNTIGMGILRMPGEVASQLPNVWLFLGIWMLGGLFALAASSSVAEIGTMILRSGGHYVFAHAAFGNYAGFVIGWSDWLSNCGSSAAVAIVIGEYLGLLFPLFAGHSVLLASLVVVVIAALQLGGIRVGSSVQQISTFLKALAFMAFVALAFAMAHGGSQAVAPRMPSGFPLFVALILSLQAVIYTYDGWAGIVYFSEETTNSSRDVPRSMLGGVLSIMVIYVLINAALVYVMPITSIAGDKLAMGTAAVKLWGAHGDTLIQVITIVSMLSAINAYQMMTCRIPMSMSRDGLFPKLAAHVNSGGTPDIALLISAGVSILFIVSGGLDKVVAVLAFFFVVNYVLDLAAVFRFRLSQPGRVRPYRAWGYPWTTGFALFAYTSFLLGAIYTDTRNSIYSLLLLGASYPVFRLVRRALRNGEHE